MANDNKRMVQAKDKADCPPKRPAKGARGRASAPLKGGKTVDSAPRMANACYDLVWRGFEHLRKFDQAPSGLLSSPSAAQWQSRLAKQAPKNSCFWLSLAACLNTDATIGVLSSIDPKKMGAVGAEEIGDLLYQYSRRSLARFCLYEITGSEDLSMSLVSSGAPCGKMTKRVFSLARVKTITDGQLTYHLLPLSDPDCEAVVLAPSLPALQTTEPAQGSGVLPPSGAEVTAPTKAEESASSAGAAPVPAPVEPPAPVEAGPVLEIPCILLTPPESTKGLDQRPEPPRLLLGVEGPRPVEFARFVSGLRACEPVAFVPEDQWEEADPHALPYEGPFSAPAGFYRVAGALPRDFQETASYWRRDAKLYAAIDGHAAVFADTVVYYVPEDPEQGLQRLGVRTLTDGIVRFRYFTAGDRVTVKGVTYVAVPYDQSTSCLIKLVPAKSAGLFDLGSTAVGKRVRRLLARVPAEGALGISTDVLIEAAVTGVDPVTQARLEFDVLRQTAADEDVALITRAFNRHLEMGGGEDAPQAHRAANYIRNLRAANPVGQFGYAGGVQFDWGYCYSCGGPRQGRLPGRICKGCRNATPAAKTLAAGQHVCAVGRLIYPGVVQTHSQHPDLKEGKETLATSQCFQVAP